jgi:ferritin-like metal-binding protein YciE
MESVMSKAEQKIVQYLNEAHALEQGLTRVLQSQIAMTPRGRYRKALESHLPQTREHARRIESRLRALDAGGNPLAFGIGIVQSALGQALAMAKAPLDLLRGSGGEEKVLKNAKDTAATEALEIATYTAIIRLARELGDTQTAELGESILEDEQHMLERVLAEIPRLTAAVVGADVNGDSSYELAETGAADAMRSAGRTAKRTARGAGAQAKRKARTARRVPGVARAEGAAKGAVASAEDLPITNYEELSAEEIVGKLGELSQVDLAKVDAFERRHQDRKTVTAKIASLRAREPWPGYDEQTIEEIRAALGDADESSARRVREYEESHKNRTGVREASERQLANA